MSYLSPFELLPQPVASLQVVDAALLRKAKRRLLAEFELGDGVQIEVKGLMWNKGQLLGVLEELEDAEKLEFHWWLHNNPRLKSFLEAPSLEGLNEVPHWNDLFDSPNRDHFSPYLAHSLSVLVKQVFRVSQPDVVLQIKKKSEVLSPTDIEDAFAPGLWALKQAIQQTRDWIRPGSELERVPEKFDLFFKREFVHCLNHLPDRYQNQRNALTWDLCNLAFLAINIFENANLARKIIGVAGCLKADLLPQSRVQEIAQQLPGFWIHPGKGAPLNAKIKYWAARGAGLISMVVIGFVVFVLWIGNYSNPAPKDRDNPNHHEYNYQPINQKSDRLFKTLNSYSVYMNQEDRRAPAIPKDSSMHGLQPYADLIGTNKVDMNDSAHLYTFINDNNWDALFFMEARNHPGKTIHYYAESGKSVSFPCEFSGTIRISAMIGEDWLPEVVEFSKVQGGPQTKLSAFRRANSELPTSTSTPRGKWLTLVTQLPFPHPNKDSLSPELHVDLNTFVLGHDHLSLIAAPAP